MKNKKNKQADPLELLQSLQSHGYDEREVTVGEVKIKLAPMTAREVIDVFELSSQYNDSDAATQALKVETLARSIVAINDIKFNPEVVTAHKLEAINKFGDDLVDMLFNQYCELDKSVKDAVDKSDLQEDIEIEES